MKPPARTHRAPNGVAAPPEPPATPTPKGFPCVALVLQGGGALGAYQGGVYEAMVAANVVPNWVAGISIGAINAAIIAGNPLETRVAKLRGFWEQITKRPIANWTGQMFGFGSLKPGNVAHGLLDKLGAMEALVGGSPGFFEPRFPPPWALPPGSAGATSYYDTGKLKATLESFVDFDRINAKEMRLSVGAVNVRTGNFIYFDTQTDKIRAEHIMASGALPPGFPAVEIDGEYYWDGGLVSNTPLQWIVDADKRQDTLAFQVDLWSARGRLPRDLPEVTVREKEIQFSSRTRATTDQLKQMQKIRAALSLLLGKVPDAVRASDEGKMLAEFADRKVYNIVQLIYRSQAYEGDSKDYNFSRRSMSEHWLAGQDDAQRALKHGEIFEQPPGDEHFQAFDFVHQHHAHPEPTPTEESAQP
ncbi:MAG: hypothetical protein JWR10_350 [Rubritepida sp.]|nr:hypothetical protein [Rubritepida sp.]